MKALSNPTIVDTHIGNTGHAQDVKVVSTPTATFGYINVNNCARCRDSNILCTSHDSGPVSPDVAHVRIAPQMSLMHNQETQSSPLTSMLSVVLYVNDEGVFLAYTSLGAEHCKKTGTEDSVDRGGESVVSDK